ncbi:S-adenosyl-L-methionine-dependent methyltransferase [Xylaria cubensis]|nr:S-adenosyl-L-methionine-dependent methyltransferase [Xylaria cubensis]
MPRLAPSLFRRAARISPRLATLLPVCRTVASAQAELRWIREHVRKTPPAPAPAPPSKQHAPQPFGNQARARRPGIARVGAYRSSTQTDLSRSESRATEDRIARLVARRGAGEPLQYVLGTQPFGDLEILCEKGVLIPRPETEAWASMLADLVALPSSSFSSRGRAQGGQTQTREEGRRKGLRILDLCSGTGCIGLSLYARGTRAPSRRWGGATTRTTTTTTTTAEEEREPGMMRAQRSPVWRVFGFDVEHRAVRLARKNLRHNFCGPRRSQHAAHGRIVEEGEGEDVETRVTFEQADIFTDTWMTSLDNDDNNPSQYAGSNKEKRRIDILVSNPPYISQRGFETDTARSVRNHEPKRALVPSRPLTPVVATCAPEDIFYARLLAIADTLRPRVAAFEVGDMAQAMRVVEMAIARSRPEENEQGDDRDGLVFSARWDVLEIWRDWPDCLPSEAEEDEEDVVVICGRRVPVRGSGHGRLVFLSEGPIPRNRFTNLGFRRTFYVG